jgi:hypothetical protein
MASGGANAIRIRRRASSDTLREQVGREERRQSEDDEQELRREVEAGTTMPPACSGGEADARDRGVTRAAITASRGDSRGPSGPRAVPR